MRLTYCPSCDGRFTDGRRYCDDCHMPTRYKDVCPYCGEIFWSTAVSNHRRMCRRLPAPEVMADMLDRDPNLAPVDLKRRYNVKTGIIVRRLARTRWHPERLYARMREVSTHRRYGRALKSLCGRCLIRGLELDDQGLCQWCREDIQRITERLWHKCYMAARGLGGAGRDYQLSQWDLDYLVAQVQGVSHE